MKDAKIEYRLLQYIQLRPREIFERADEDFFTTEDYATIFKTLSVHYLTYSDLPTNEILHSLFEDEKLESMTIKILSDPLKELKLSELEYIIEYLRNLKVSRSLRPIILSTADLISKGKGVEALDNLQNDVLSVYRNSSKYSTDIYDPDGDINFSVPYRMDRMLAVKEDPIKSKKFNTGFSGFDDYSGGFKSGQLIIYAAPTSDGKSISLLNNSGNMYLEGHNVIFLSLEMSRLEVEARFDSWLTGIDIKKLYTGDLTRDEWLHYKKCLIKNSLDITENTQYIYDLENGKYDNDYLRRPITDILIHDLTTCPKRRNSFYPLDIARNCTLEVLESKFNFLRAKCGCDVLVIDYAGIMSHAKGGSNTSSWQDLDDLFFQLKGFARYYKILVMTAAQLKDEEIGSNERFNSSWLRFSKSIANHCDCGLGWIRSLQDVRNKELTIRSFKTRNMDSNFEILCETSFNNMRVYEKEFKIL